MTRKLSPLENQVHLKIKFTRKLGGGDDVTSSPGAGCWAVVLSVMRVSSLATYDACVPVLAKVACMGVANWESQVV